MNGLWIRSLWNSLLYSTYPQRGCGRALKNDAPLPAHADIKISSFSVLFLFHYLDGFHDHFNIACSTDNVVIWPICDRGLVVDTDIVLYIWYTESTTTRCKMNRLKNVFMAPAELEVQWVLPNIGWLDHLQPQVVRPFVVCNTVSNPPIIRQRHIIGLFFVNHFSMLVNTGMSAAKDYDIGLRRTSRLPSFFYEPIYCVVVHIGECNLFFLAQG